MRITIEVNDAENRSVTFQQQAESITTAMPAAAESVPINGGPAAEALLLALGATTDAAGTNGTTSQTDGNAGEPAKWLVDALSSAIPIFEVSHGEHGG
jgi:hypothetical protein